MRCAGGAPAPTNHYTNHYPPATIQTPTTTTTAATAATTTATTAATTAATAIKFYPGDPQVPPTNQSRAPSRK